PGSGLLVLLPSGEADSLKRPVFHSRQDSASDVDITYEYTPVSQVSRMAYPQDSVEVVYTYNSRKWLTEIAAAHYPTFSGWIFREQLMYDSAGQILQQRSRTWGNGWLEQNYQYDRAQRLVWWRRPSAG